MKPALIIIVASLLGHFATVAINKTAYESVAFGTHLR